MTDDEDASTATKKLLVPSAVKCPMLTSSNYTVWSIRMKVLLELHEVWETIDPGSSDKKKNTIALALLFQSILENLILQVGELGSSKGIWDTIKARNLGADRVKEARLQTLMAEFEHLTMKESDTIDIFAGKISEYAANAASLGHTLEVPKMVKKFLHGLPEDKFIHMVASLEQVLDLNNTSYEDIVGRLKAYEERITKRKNKETQDNLLFSSSDAHGAEKRSGNSRGRGGGRGSQGRGRGKSNTQERNGKEKKNRADVVC